MKITLQLNGNEAAEAIGLAEAYNALNKTLGGTGQISAAMAVRLMIDGLSIQAKKREVEERWRAALDAKAQKAA